MPHGLGGAVMVLLLLEGAPDAVLVAVKRALNFILFYSMYIVFFDNDENKSFRQRKRHTFRQLDEKSD